MLNTTTRNSRITTEIFISRAIIKHGCRYDYSNAIYKGARKELSIICRNHGEFRQIAGNHLNGSGCPKCKSNYKLNNDSFKEKARIKHGDYYDYSKSIYKGIDKKITINCYEHGEFTQIASSHLNGSECPKCRKHVFNNETFISKSKSIYGDKYDYLIDSFVLGNDYVKVVCREHGIFKQKMNNHFRYDGCKSCKTQRKMMSAAIACRDDKTSYKRMGYINICKNNNGMSNLYVVKMAKDKEVFYKVGITKRSLRDRFRSNPYEITEIILLKGEAGFIFDFEKQIHRILSKNQYRPLIKFEGSTLECFSKIPKRVIKLIESVSKSNQLQLLV